MQRKRLTLTLILLACVAIALFAVGYPIYVIRPFRHQGAQELAVALVVARFRVIAASAAALTAAIAFYVYWRSMGSWRGVLAGLGVLVTLALAYASRVNIYEMMFHPVARASFSQASEMKLDADEKVIAIKVGNEARAYPIRSMSYHHVLNDVVGGTAVAATY
jgi:hypothetical protein